MNLGLAIDLPKPDGTRQLLVPSIKSCETLDFAQFWAAYEEMVKKARAGSLTVEDFAGTTITLTNPGTIGTNHSVPRLMQGQGCIIGVGSMEYPPEFQGSDPDKLSDMSVAKVMTLTSTYDHRVIQGAQSGQYLAAAARTCCSARTASTTTSSARCGSRTSRSAGPRTSAPTTRTRSPSRPGSWR